MPRVQPSRLVPAAFVLLASLASAATPEPAVGTLTERPKHASFKATHAASAGFELREIEPGVISMLDPDRDRCFDDGTRTERFPTLHVRGLENASTTASVFLPVVRREELVVEGRGARLVVDDAAYDVHTGGVQLLAHQSLRVAPLGTWVNGSVQLFGARDGAILHLVARGLDVLGEPSARSSAGTQWGGECAHRYARLSVRDGSWIDFDLPAVVPNSEHVTAAGVCLRSERTLRVRTRVGANGVVGTQERWIGAPHTEAIPGGTHGKPCPPSVASGGAERVR